MPAGNPFAVAATGSLTPKRFAGVSALAGAAAALLGPRVGGVFLAFPAILIEMRAGGSVTAGRAGRAGAPRHNEWVARRDVPRTVAPDPTSPCPCGLGQPYRECCGRLHRGEATAATAELLMRSRFSAFAVSDAPYLLRTWHSTTRPRQLRFDPGQRWSRLEILGGTGGGLLDADGAVEFRAHYRQHGQSGVLHERSRFVREDGRWVYVGPVPSGRDV
ncbi:YchJ family metal-binding protein [Planosporangium sp. 12N6]|uniref:YchJ family protein n=1 Tax=Planosporangium spinosum TaxID=3402278 RepID=UPI003CF0C730